MQAKKRNLFNELKQGITEINHYHTKKITLRTHPIKERSIKSDLKRLDVLKDEDIDYADSPALDHSFFERATVEFPKPKGSITLRVDHNVLEWFKQQGRGYQTKMHAVLKAYIQAHRD